MKHKYFILILFVFGIVLSSVLYLNKKNQQPLVESSMMDIKNIPEKVFYTEKVFSNLTPKTNSWISSAFFKKDSDPLFVYPYSLDFNNKGFTVGIPTITSTERSILGPHSENIAFSFAENLETHVVDYGDIDATLELRKSNGESIATVKLIRGVPYIYINFLNNSTLSIKANTIKQDGNIFQIDDSFRVYNIKNNTSKNPSVLDTTFNKGDTFIIGSIPRDNQFSDLDNYSNTIISQISVRKTNNDSLVNTNYIFKTVDDKPILFGKLNNTNPINTSAVATPLKYSTIKGDINIYKGNQFEFQDTLYLPITKIDTSKYNDTEKLAIRNAIFDDLTVTNFKDDTYYGGKTMARQAYLYEIARDFGWDDITEQIISPLKQELISWLSDTSPTHSFVYEPNIKTLVGIPNSFGSELANDHHFHYGYIIYAASVVAEQDTEFLKDNKEKISLILEDYASINQANTVFPYLRVFDQYELHSWASGFALFQDGNNQESTSEAINAWYAMYRWSHIIKDENMKDIAQWLYSQEINTTLAFWLNPKDIISNKEYKAPIVSLVWGGKLDYATWFSDTDEAKLAIQLLPLNFSSQYIKKYPDLIKSHIDYIKSKKSDSNIPFTEFKDLLLTYESTINSNVIPDIQNINSKNFDDGNSKAASLVWAFGSN